MESSVLAKLLLHILAQTFSNIVFRDMHATEKKKGAKSSTFDDAGLSLLILSLSKNPIIKSTDILHLLLFPPRISPNCSTAKVVEVKPGERNNIYYPVLLVER